MAEDKRVSKEHAERGNHTDSHRRYYDHLNGMGLTAEEVVDIAEAFLPKPTA